ncbi:MAG: ATP-dependent DNA helicase RecG, partial [Prevotella sp.]|nr:ATP-dependent DNA helicase RecG [Prevotella sp.]
MTRDLKHTDITYVPGIGPARAKILREELNIATWHDLLYYFPYKHIDRSRLYSISELTSDMPFVQVKGQFLSFEESGVGRKRHLTGHFTDGHSVMDLVWFNGIKYIIKNTHLHRDYIIFGRPSVFNGRISVSHPDVDPADSLILSKMSMQPYYSVSEKMKKRGLNSHSIERFTSSLFLQIDFTIPETLPEYLLKKLNLMPLDQALRCAHYPTSA